MIASNAVNDQFLGTFQLALLMKAENEKSLSESLISYCDELLKQIKTLIEGKISDKDEFLPEAVKIALKIHQTSELSKSLIDIPNFHDISKAEAIEIIDALREHAN